MKREELEKVLEVVKPHTEPGELFVVQKGKGLDGLFVTGTDRIFNLLSNRAIYIIMKEGIFSKKYTLYKRIPFTKIVEIKEKIGIMGDPSYIKLKTSEGEETLVISKPWSPNLAFMIPSLIGGLLSEGKRKNYREYVIAMIKFAMGKAKSDEYEFIGI